jgi:hypothetical protein
MLGEEPKSIPVEDGAVEPPHIGEEAPEKIPEAKGQAIGELALGEDTNPGAPQVSGANYVMDESKARTMADAGDELRTKAVANRDIKSDHEEHQDAYDSTFSHAPRTGVQRNMLMNARDREFAALEASEQENTRARHEFAEDFRHGESFVVFPNDDAAERAKAYDERASRVEDWAGALHDHQVSEGFKKAHPDIELNPQNLVYMEDDIAIVEEEIAELSKPSEAVTNDTAALIRGTKESTKGGRHVREIYEMLTSADKEHSDTWEKLSGEMYAKAAEIDALYSELVKEVKLGPLKNQLAMSGKVMGDIKQELRIAEQASEPETTNKTGSAE